jgi:hypothetical protein
MDLVSELITCLGNEATERRLARQVVTIKRNEPGRGRGLKQRTVVAYAIPNRTGPALGGAELRNELFTRDTTCQQADAKSEPYLYLHYTTKAKEERRLHWPLAQSELARDVTARPGMSASLAFSPIASGPSQCAHINFAVCRAKSCCPQQHPAPNIATSNTAHISTPFRTMKPTFDAYTNPLYCYVSTVNCLLQEVTPIFKT